MRALLLNAYATARRIITENKELHHTIAEALLEREEMLEDEFDAFFHDIDVPKKLAM